jgi:Methyltransferase domain
MSFPFDLDPDERDPGGWATSLLHNAEFVLGCLDAAQARSVIEVGAFRGELTRLLLRWADGAGASVTAIDTAPHPDLAALVPAHANLRLLRDPSLNALARIEPADVMILDGDHNYYTVSHELRLIAQRATDAGRQLPLLLLHDVGWPHGRRDDYYAPERIPPEHRQPLARAGLHPDEPGTVSGGIPCDNPAAREGGPGNGVLTAAEDFIAEHERLRLAIVPAFYGLGVIWHVDDPHADAISELLSTWDRNPVLQRMEDNRVLHLANGHVQWTIARDLREQVADRDRRLARSDELLSRMLRSRTFAAAELYLRARQRVPAFSRRQIRQVIG